MAPLAHEDCALLHPIARGVAGLCFLMACGAGPLAFAQGAVADSAGRLTRVAHDSGSVQVANTMVPTPAVQPRWYFHRPDIRYGSAAYRGPLGTFVDRGMSIVVFGDAERELNRIKWREGWEAVSDALTHPDAAIQRAGGWGQFLRKEFLPDNGSIWKWAWAPNYGGHIIAGGITHRYLAEWFEDHGTPHPKIAAGVSYMAMMVTNEVLEHPHGKPGSSGTVGDLLIFEPLGMLIFSSDRVAGFFSHKLLAADWSPQASLQFPRASIVNNSQVMSYKVPLPLTSRARVILLLGQGAATGVSVKLTDEFALSAALGFETQTRTVNPVTQEESVRADYGGGMYIDRDNSLLASVVLSKRFVSRTSLNVFPGILPGVLNPLGLWAQETPRGEWSFGFGYRHAGGLGLGWNGAR